MFLQWHFYCALIVIKTIHLQMKKIREHEK